MCYVGGSAARALRSWLNARLPARRTSRATRNKRLSWVMRFVSDAPPLVLRLGYIGLRRERFQYGVGDVGRFARLVVFLQLLMCHRLGSPDLLVDGSQFWIVLVLDERLQGMVPLSNGSFPVATVEVRASFRQQILQELGWRQIFLVRHPIAPGGHVFPPLEVSSDVLKRTGEIAFKIPSGESPF